MFGRVGFRPGFGGFGHGFRPRFGFGAPFLLGAIAGAAFRPYPYYYGYPYPYPPYPYYY